MAEFINQQEGERFSCAVHGELNIYSASQVRDELLHNLACHAQVEVDLANVADFDSSGVQILLVLRREAQRSGKNLSFVHHSQAVREVLDLLNLVGELGDPMIIPLDATGSGR